MPKSKDENVPYKRLVLGFDGGCSACGELARQVGEKLEGRLGVISLDDPRAIEWRGKALGGMLPGVPPYSRSTATRSGRGPANRWASN